MIIRTRKYKIPKSKYIKITFRNLLRKRWWIALLVGLISFLFFYTGHSTLGTISVVLFVLFFLFTFFQVYAVTMLDQNKILFDPFSYQISSKNILMQLTTKQGMTIEWEQIKWVKKDKKNFTLFLSPVQFIYLPHRVFRTPQEITFMNILLQRKRLLKGNATTKKTKKGV